MTDDVLDQHCAAIGRDPNQIVRSVQIIVTAEDPTPDASTPLPQPMGPSAAREFLVELVDTGASHLVLAPIGFASVQQLADEVVAPVMAHVRSSTAG
jgi:hypothetical protein